MSTQTPEREERAEDPAQLLKNGRLSRIRAGLIAQRREAQWRRCRVEAGPLKEVADWTERYRHVWEERFDQLDRYLQRMKAKETKQYGRGQRKTAQRLRKLLAAAAPAW